ncbi:ATP-binding protein [Bacillus sp. AK031]
MDNNGAGEITGLITPDLKVENAEKLSIAGQLAAGIAHEIRNPITVIKGFIQLLNSNEKNEYFTIISSEIERIEQILSELLILSKPQETKFEHIEIMRLLNQVITLLNPHALLYNVEIIKDFHTKDVLIECDENQLKQVFINYIKNSVESMSDGGKLIIKVRESGVEAVSILFIDEGVGMAEEVLSNLGKPFFTTKEKGTGLGYIISKKIIETHSGEVSVLSEVNSGTTIEVTLPLSQGLF